MRGGICAPLHTIGLVSLHKEPGRVPCHIDKCACAQQFRSTGASDTIDRSCDVDPHGPRLVLTSFPDVTPTWWTHGFRKRERAYLRIVAHRRARLTLRLLLSEVVLDDGDERTLLASLRS